MRRIFFQLTTLLFIIHLAACHHTNSLELLDQNTPDLAEDSLAIHATLENWYNAMYKVDSTGILELLTPQFLLLEDTLPLSGTELVARLKKGEADVNWTAEFSEFRTRFRGEVAWTTLKNQETLFQDNGKKCKADFLETIVFVRYGERWLIDRYHATPIHRWTCEDE